ncbi:MAG TPA: SOS response-associated peptidase [Gammaproteobacteria bacterium]|nr:SOS response-associated peptidase [Gammaproteobacteria bacterium]
MCGRLVLPDSVAIRQQMDVDSSTARSFERRFNVAPTATVPIIIARPDGGRVLQPARWGLAPPWWQEQKLPSHTFNARSEDAWKKPMWRAAIRNARCLLPAEGWYEWRTLEVIDRETGEVTRGKQPYFIHDATRPLLALAGLYSRGNNTDAGFEYSCAVLTRAASPALQAIHNRMPVVLREDAWRIWLAAQETPEAIDAAIAGSADDLAFHAVSARVNNARVDDAALIEPIESSDDSNTIRR